MHELGHIVSLKRRYLLFVIAVIGYLLIISLLSPVIETKRASVLADSRSSYVNQMSQGDDTDIISNDWSNFANSTSKAADSVELKALGTAATTADGVKATNKDVQKGSKEAAVFTAHTATILGTSAVDVTIDSIKLEGHIVGDTFGLTDHVVGGSLSFMGNIIGGGFSFSSHIVGTTFGLFTGKTHLSSIIQPTDNTPTPVINKLRAQQAAIIESGTKAALTSTQTPAVTTASAVITSGTGGACDSGNGNGGYPIDWCNAPMDTIATLAFNDDPINRECTSYADWYFTTVEGHTDFKALGNAKYWATSSNYPTHSTPTVGAIAVETAGAYGHVAIVKALPGQMYDGQPVPAGYVLVSEMNYDWHGHFRYSYSPLSKFSSYIYP
jgi:hypothetical protein